MKRYPLLRLALMFAALMSLASCSDDDDEMDYTYGEHTKSEAKIIKDLVGTSWTTNEHIFYDYKKNVVASYDDSNSPDYITFTDIKASEYSDDMILYVDYHDKSFNNGYTLVSYWNVEGNVIIGFPGSGNCFGEVLSLNQNTLKTRYDLNSDNEWYRIDTYERTSEPVHKFKPGTGTGTGGDDGGSTSYEKPDIGLYDYTATQTSLKVRFEIFNKNEAKVSSAKVYYGTSSNPSNSKSAIVSGRLITVYLTGLKAGTVYYVKCSATGKVGTSTTPVIKCMTEY